jgi:hypothetical protein
VALISSPQQMMSHASTHPHASSTDTTSPQTSHAYRSPDFTFFLAVLAGFVAFAAAGLAAAFAVFGAAAFAVLGAAAFAVLGAAAFAVLGAAGFAVLGAAGFAAFFGAAFAAVSFPFGATFAIRPPPCRCLTGSPNPLF